MSSGHSSAADVPLAALRAFVAAGRHKTFTRAAAALGVTQGVVSRHVATLERMGGARLFDRRGAQATLTPAGAQLYNAVHDAFAAIELASQQLTQRRRRGDRLSVRTSMPTLALTVLMPALPAFSERHGVQVDLVTSLTPVGPRDEFDVLITRDLDLSGAECWELATEELVCVAAPAQAKIWSERPAHRWPIISARSRPEILATWALAHGVAPEKLDVKVVDEHLYLAIARAISGAGILVVPRLLVLDHLVDRTLVCLPKAAVRSGARYLAFVNPHGANMQEATSFCRWLKAELGKRNEKSS
jgi:LysR family glycine cleavage system transcriptional activator